MLRPRIGWGHGNNLFNSFTSMVNMSVTSCAQLPRIVLFVKTSVWPTSRSCPSGEVNSYSGNRRFPPQLDNCSHHIGHCLSWWQLLTRARHLALTREWRWENDSCCEVWIPAFWQHQHVPQPGARSAFPLKSITLAEETRHETFKII